MFPLTHFSVHWPPYVTAPQTIIETSLFLGGQTRYGASFSSSHLQQYILESLLITTEHSSEKLKFFQISNAQFLRALAHLIRNSLFFVLITIDFLIALLTYFSFISCPWFPHGTSKRTELRSAQNFETHGTSKYTELRSTRNFEMHGTSKISSKPLCILLYLNQYYSSYLTA